MLKITIQEAPDTVTMKLEGRVAGLWALEFNRSWQSLEPLLGSKALTLDLRGVSFIDRGGRLLLEEIYEKTGADFLTASPLTKYYAEEAMHKA